MTVQTLALELSLGLEPRWILAAAALLVVLMALRRMDGRARRLSPLRALAFAAILWILVSPPTRLADAPDETTRPTVIFLADTSASMSVADETVGRDTCTRWDAVRADWLDPDRIEQIRSRANVRFVGVDTRTSSTSLAGLLGARPDGRETRLSRGLRALVAAIEDQGSDGVHVALLTDGIDTDAEPPVSVASAAIGAGVRIHGVVVGSELAAPDVALSAHAQNEAVYAGQTSSIAVRLTQTGFDGRAARLVVRDQTTGRIVHERVVTLGDAAPIRVPVTPDADPDQAASLAEYTVSIDVLEGEIDETNNERSVFLRVTSGRVRVCVFEAQPYWDTRFFVQALRDDPQIDLTVVHSLGSEVVAGEVRPRLHVVRYVPDASSSYEERLPTAPLDEDALREFDVVVLGKGIDLMFPSARAEILTRFVTEHAGALVFLRGAPIEREDPGAQRAARILSEVSPVEWGRGLLPGGSLEVTKDGRLQRPLQFDQPMTPEEAIEGLPGVLATSAVEREKTLSVVWLRRGDSDDDESPAAIASMDAGRGRTLAVLTDGLWRWRFLPPVMEGRAGVYQAFWSRAIRWLALGGDFLPGQSVSLDVDRLATTPGRPVAAIVRTRLVGEQPFEPTLTVRGPDGQRHPVELSPSPTSPSRLVGMVTPAAEGVFELELREPSIDPERLTAKFTSYDDRLEIIDTAARPEEVRALCEATGGSMLETSDDLLRVLDAEREASMTTRRRVPAWDSPIVFLAIIGALGIEWILRRRAGLP